jgi:hypothetical protein
MTPLPASLRPSRPGHPLLVGAWRMLECHVYEQTVRPSVEVLWVVRGERMVVRHAGVVQPPPDGAWFALVQPAGGGAGSVDYAVRYPDRDALTLPGVYETRGEGELALCLATVSERPGGCEPGPDRIAYTFERVPDAKK